MTGQADRKTAVAAVNESSIFRFLAKPCWPEVLNAALISALEQHRLIIPERELPEKTLSGSIKLLPEVRKFELASMLCPLGYNVP